MVIIFVNLHSSFYVEGLANHENTHAGRRICTKPAECQTHRMVTNFWYALNACIIFIVSYFSFYRSRLSVGRNAKSGI